MTCYFRHLQNIFEKAVVSVTADNKRELDKVIHGIVGVKYKDCQRTWSEVKRRIAQDEKAFISELREAASNLGQVSPG